MKILILAFKNTVTETIAKDLRISTKKVYLESNKEWIERFVTRFDFAEYDYILALGEYNGRDKDAIRIETECSSQFRNNKERLEELTIPYFLKPEPPFKLVNGIGNSWCNLISYRMLSKSSGQWRTRAS